jgi:cysteine desulfurase / selenocysteine lyase
MDPWRSLREQFPVTERLVYLDHAAVCPLPLRARERIAQYVDELVSCGSTLYPEGAFGAVKRARSLGARLLGARPEQVFIVRSTTQGLGIAATGLPVSPGDNVVLVEREFPANIRPWLPLRRRGVEVRFVPQHDGRVRIDDLAARVDARTRAVSVSFVQFLSGFRIDLAAVAELCRRHDALFVVDAIQGLGAFPLDVVSSGVDFLSADSHKWLLGPEGVGLGYASARALERIAPAVEGWLSVRDPFAFFDVEQPLKETAERFEEGAYGLVGIHGMLGGLELILERGVEAIAARILELTDELVERLGAAGWTVRSPRSEISERSGIVLADRPGVDFVELRRRLQHLGFVVSVRGGALRVAPHAYNTVEELERLVTALSAGPG